VFNCHKITDFKVGASFDLEDVHDDADPKNRILNAIYTATDEAVLGNQPNVKFFGHLLRDDERLSKMDLEYWIDYVYLFGVKELIPLYDKMDPITYRNWDVYILNWTIVALTILFWKKVICCCLGCCGKKDDKVKQE
jgi:hypothetical protein